MVSMYLRLEGSFASLIIDSEYNCPERESNKNPASERNNPYLVLWFPNFVWEPKKVQLSSFSSFPRSQTLFGNAIRETPFRASLIDVVEKTRNRVSRSGFPNGVWEPEKANSKGRQLLLFLHFHFLFLPFSLYSCIKLSEESFSMRLKPVPLWIARMEAILPPIPFLDSLLLLDTQLTTVHAANRLTNLRGAVKGRLNV